jgi:hypothetical protein
MVLRVVLFLAGSFVVLTGLDSSLGGMRTLGWLGPNDFVTVKDAYAFAVQDNHSKFLAGVWLGVGFTLWAGARNPERFRQALRLVFALVFLGGMMRLASSNPEIAFGQDVIGSLAAELIGMPILYIWHRHVVRGED